VNTKRIAFISVITALLCIVNTSVVKADMFGFYNITNNGNPDLSSQLSVNVTAGSSGQVLFTFYNNIGIQSSICDIYFDDNSGVLSDVTSINNSSGVSFSENANPHNLPGGEPYDFYANFSADSDHPVEHNGVDSASENVGLLFSLKNNKNFSDVIAAINAGNLRIGLHIQAIQSSNCCNGGGSDSYINKPGNVVPVPGALMLGMLGMMVAGVKLRKYT
jgi:hypothetical protein